MSEVKQGPTELRLTNLEGLTCGLALFLLAKAFLRLALPLLVGQGDSGGAVNLELRSGPTLRGRSHWRAGYLGRRSCPSFTPTNLKPVNRHFNRKNPNKR